MTASSDPSPPAPSHIFIVRHGARLDAADKNWAHSSPTPYDTPLTYGGWLQSRHLGTRIASILHTEHPHESTKTKQKRIVVHCSPFLRCIQTAISIASGIAQHHHQLVTDAHFVTEEEGRLVIKGPPPETERFVKPVLRLDAWLGEWMTMDYYTEITPPPVSQLMVNTARNEYMSAPVSIPGGDAKSPPLLALDRSTLPASATGGYVPPSPAHAVSTSGMIPIGYVSHAKEYVDFDFAWDPTRLGTGAELGEEWSAMHRRFKSGYKRLMWYYHDEKPSVATSTQTSSHMKKHPSAFNHTNGSENASPTPPLSDSDIEEDDDIETIVILVTHGAGCNALLGAITDKPVLIDIGIGSLSLAVLSNKPAHRTSARPDDIANPPFTYDLKLTANTEHNRIGSPLLRPGTPSTPPISPYIKARPHNVSGLGNFVLSSSGVSGNSLSVAMGELDLMSHHRSASTGNTGRPSGLWSMPRPEDRERPRSRGWEGGAEEVAVEESEEPPAGAPTDGKDASAKGLWAARAWDRPTKRRWTIGREAWNGEL